MRMYMENKKLMRVWTPKSSGVLYPMNQIPPEKKALPGFAWFDYIRPQDKDDIYVWRPKRAGTELKSEERPEAPRSRLLPPKAAVPPSLEAAAASAASATSAASAEASLPEASLPTPPSYE